MTRSYSSFGATRFAAIVDPNRIRAGANTIALFALQGRPGAWQLASLGQVTNTYKLVGESDSAELVDSSGRRVPVVPGALDGFVEEAEVEEGTFEVSGWAASKRLGAAKRVAVFAGDRFLTASRLTTPRPRHCWGTGGPVADIRVHGRQGTRAPPRRRRTSGCSRSGAERRLSFPRLKPGS